MAKTGVGCRWQPEMSVGKDPVSGATVRQMTSYKGHSSHFYLPIRAGTTMGARSSSSRIARIAPTSSVLT